MKVEVKGINETREWLKNIDRNLERKILAKLTSEARNEVKKIVAKQHTKTGRLESNIDSKVKDGYGEVFIHNEGMLVSWRGKRVNYAAFVLFGARPHVIEPKRKKVLRFSYKNLDEFIYRKKVHHPGYKGDDFLYRGAKQALKKLDEIYEQTIKEIK